MPVQVEEDRRVGAHGHEPDVGEGEHPCPEGDVHGEGQQGVDAHLGQQELVGAVEAQRVRE